MIAPRRYSTTPLGEHLRSFRLEGFVLTEADYRPSLNLSKHIHDHAVISITLSGSYTELLGRRPQECKPYSVLLKAAGDDHSDSYGSTGARCLIIKVEPKRLEAMRSFSRVLEHSLHVRDAFMASLSLRLYREFKLMDDASVLSIEGLILEVLGHSTRPSSPPLSSGLRPHWLRKAEAMIRESAAEPLSLLSVAVAVGVHPSHLARTFRKFYGCTVGDYLRHARIERAVAELAHENKSLADVALAAGFYDQSHFTRAFKTHLGTTPKRYRAALRSR
ncbi:MAG TPA: AraC family transcriptional regulator [Pyrinomonadaceae bacterium]